MSTWAMGRCTCGETVCESELCDCDSAPCPVDHAREDDRRERYAGAILDALARDTTRGPNWGAAAEAVMAMADEEITDRLNAERSNAARYLFERDVAQSENDRLRAELDENTGIIRALRRQRDTAEEALKRVDAVLTEWYGTSDAGAVLSEIRTALNGDTE